jgi:hypothetical protein
MASPCFFLKIYVLVFKLTLALALALPQRGVEHETKNPRGNKQGQIKI